MGTYSKVDWQANDEVTSEKLQQMSDNIEWVKDNYLKGRMLFSQNIGLGKVAGGRTRGTKTATRIEAYQYPFDSLQAMSEFEVKMPLHPVFSEPPIVIANAASIFQRLTLRVFVYGNTSWIKFRIMEIDGRSRRMQGEINALLIGV